MKIYIYSLEHPITKKVRYIGKTRNPKQRLKAHLNPARYKPTHKFNWIKKLKNDGLKPILKVLDSVPEEEWKFWEKYWIEQFKQWGFNLVNGTSGGDGLTSGNKTSFKKGNKPWNTGTANTKKCEVCGTDFKVYPSQAHKRKACSHKCGAILKKQITKKHNLKKEQFLGIRD
jgi:predicted nucleic acid-binding Zn ribbon protein